jgi:YfiH family protein
VAEADASWTGTPGIACTAMTADCLPALFCDRAGTRVAAAHAGWRGLAGVLEATLDSLGAEPADVLVWLGPAIGPQAFEVGPEVREAFVQQLPKRPSLCAQQRPGKFMADIYQLARLRLAARGVTAVYGGGFCTVTDPRFFSYRRSPRTGRFASCLAGALDSSDLHQLPTLESPESTASIGLSGRFLHQDGYFHP